MGEESWDTFVPERKKALNEKKKIRWGRGGCSQKEYHREEKEGRITEGEEKRLGESRRQLPKKTNHQPGVKVSIKELRQTVTRSKKETGGKGGFREFSPRGATHQKQVSRHTGLRRREGAGEKIPGKKENTKPTIG